MTGPGTNRPRPVALIILDGWGLRAERENNAVALADTPVMDELWASWPHSQLEASGEAVGLPKGLMGNSNVGHLNLGAGRIVYQDIVRISRAIADGSFFENEVLVGAARRARERGGRLHLIGLVSDGGVHSSLEHLLALLELGRRQGVETVVHAFTDGRDTPPTSAPEYVRRVEEAGGRIATVVGRYFAMDRDKRWDRTERAYRALVLGEGHRAPSAAAALEQAYARGQTDEFIEPVVITDAEGRPLPRITARDETVFFNFRADRARQLARALADPGFDAFRRPEGAGPVPLTQMIEYDEEFTLPTAFPPVYLKETFGEVVARAGLRQLRIAETEKYAHVTYFFNGREETPFPGEERVLIPSPKVATYDLKPEMSAPEVTERVVAEIGSGRFDAVVLNFANPDMVGHTGVLEAAIQACATVDRCLGRVLEAIRRQGGAALVLADHGNAEIMVDPATGEPHTAHTTSPVPCVLVDPRHRHARLRDGILADAAPTLLELMGLEPPGAMTGRSLIVA
ncbi:phosphoglycerate mutase [Thermaerobacter marianensis DSM 12885]|uniref:2,3-bisphosphoglycerate-independent phosphoglycerate mutase n=1 Tax=Thermaerobacter marianensis (strain ATCC 700841 / DSM 12885 / JCM 10246 / 7p75a) TaxID=644966 RepID=E6SKU5_THEM7|nr:2,3-bisphosphoglycerate-independent phosphoglycerate mutase [Thermaerobacter marianensis]ADU52318.1 phosphoglycerate mutase [Thermaerobacter marianensis DSM 12885]